MQVHPAAESGGREEKHAAHCSAGMGLRSVHAVQDHSLPEEAWMGCLDLSCNSSKDDCLGCFDEVDGLGTMLRWLPAD